MTPTGKNIECIFVNSAFFIFAINE